MKPIFVRKEDIPESILAKEKEIYRAQFKNSDKPKDIMEKMIKGKLEKYQKENSLTSQTWIKDSNKTIEDLIEEYIVKLGENIVIKKFVRYEL
jgi:elongation factor Ts